MLVKSRKQLLDAQHESNWSNLTQTLSEKTAIKMKNYEKKGTFAGFHWAGI